MAEQLKITLSRGLVGKTKTQISVVRALGLKKFGSSVTHSASPTITGMIRKVEHLLTVCPAEASEGKKAKTHRKPASKKAVES
jgi:large subunit ribosomal protein L30